MSDRLADANEVLSRSYEVAHRVLGNILANDEQEGDERRISCAIRLIQTLHTKRTESVSLHAMPTDGGSE